MCLLLNICCSSVVVCILRLKCHQEMIIAIEGIIVIQLNGNI